VSDLTPEERQRIYLEEKARLEVRLELEGKKTSAGKILGIVVPCGFGLLAVMWIIGSFLQQSEADAFRNSRLNSGIRRRWRIGRPSQVNGVQNLQRTLRLGAPDEGCVRGAVEAPRAGDF
jgi:hypothetical protein